MPVNVGNQLGGSLVDGLKACSKLFQLLVFRPCCDIAEAVFAGCDTVVGAHGKGNAFSLDFLGITIFLLLGLKLIGGDFTAHKVQSLFLGEPQRPILGNIQRLCGKNGTGVVDHNIVLDGHGFTGVIVGATQIVAVQTLGDIRCSNAPVGEQTGNIKDFDLLVLGCIGRRRLILLVVELGVGNFVDNGGDRLHLTHALADGDTLTVQREEAIRAIL